MAFRPTELIDRHAGRLAFLARQPDIAFALAFCIILAVLFVPLPPVLLDLGLAFSFAIAIMILMVALWVPRPLEFTSFPTLLLVVTILRLSLSVASTRLILSEGHTGTNAAGHVIEGIANFVIGGDFIIGAIVFAILVTINFIVITKGSSRIAEVSARFSLDAMPGKQMAIDADLNAGLIDEAEKRRRQKELEAESGFFGAMDGAAKFVRGDAIAALIIVVINLVGGVLIATLRHGMGIGDAMRTFAVLTIGDGLVSQIPALVISVAAGMIVAKGTVEGSAGKAITGQLTSASKPLLVTAALIFGMGLLPGFPFAIFAFLALAVALTGLYSDHSRRQQAEADRRNEQHRKATADGTEATIATPRFDAIQLDLGTGLVMMVSDQDASLPAKVRNLRDMFMKEYGFLLPPVRISDVAGMDADAYVIRVQGAEVASGMIQLGGRLLIDPDNRATNVQGRRVREPSFGLPAIWIEASRAATYERQGFTVVDEESVIITHLIEVIRDNMPELLSYSSVNELANGLGKDHQKLLNDIAVPAPRLMLQHVLQNLLRERVSVQNLPRIVEAMADAAGNTKSVALITEQVRRALATQISHAAEVVRPGNEDRAHDAKSRYIPVMTLSPEWEREFASSISLTNGDFACTMNPRMVQDFVLAVQIASNRFEAKGERPALLVAANYRPVIRAMTERAAAQTPVISYQEVARNSVTRTVETIGK